MLSTIQGTHSTFWIWGKKPNIASFQTVFLTVKLHFLLKTGTEILKMFWKTGNSLHKWFLSITLTYIPFNCCGQQDALVEAVPGFMKKQQWREGWTTVGLFHALSGWWHHLQEQEQFKRRPSVTSWSSSKALSAWICCYEAAGKMPKLGSMPELLQKFKGAWLLDFKLMSALFYVFLKLGWI